ncbi:MAG TPA: methylated-DNA--[protein]-cysteine S-methyltransferase [Myxococcaceae bacterium]|nr:methylated-DNA--[protein]-cysteine S-methyltransferase [Myxococcaceae bacterium]
MKTPVGELRLFATDAALLAVHLPRYRHRSEYQPVPASSHPILDRAANELEEYFRGKRSTFTVPLLPDGTDFQREVWAALRTIPCGETRSYADIARALQRPKAVRAVGAANGRNPIPIIVPCHRVIGTSGELVGFGGGLPMKRWLLEHERQFIPSEKRAWAGVQGTLSM